jgi:hypothetical protein
LAGERRIEWSEDSYSRIRSLALPGGKTPPCSGDCGVALGWRPARDRSADGSAPFLNEPHGAPSPTGLTRSADGSEAEGSGRANGGDTKSKIQLGWKLAGETRLRDALGGGRGWFGQAPFPSRFRFQNGPRRQGFATPRPHRAPWTSPGRSEPRAEMRERGQMQRHNVLARRQAATFRWSVSRHAARPKQLF